MSATSTQVGEAGPCNYRLQLAADLAAGKVPSGQLTIVHVFHDDWCGIFRGRPCDCDVVIRYEPYPGQGTTVSHD